MAKETPDGQQKTEDATGKKLNDARNRGQVAKSMDAVNATIMLLGGWMVYSFGEGMFDKISGLMSYLLRVAPLVSVTDTSVPHYYTVLVLFIASLTLPLMFIIMIIGVSIEISQVGFHFATEKFTKGINFAQIFNPFTGMKRMFFSKTAYFEIIKNSFKLLLFGTIVYQVLASKTDALMALMQMPFSAISTFMAKTGFELVVKVGSVYACIAVADYFFQKRRFKEDMKMSKQEVKEESKQAEGDVGVKQRIRNIGRQRLRKIMLKNVSMADVIITNPTHYAVAISYAQGNMSAPKVVAKGVDFLALKIREIATANEVPIVEDPPLARTLYATCEVDQEIPEKLFKAVAQVLAYIYRLKRRK